MIFGCHYRVRYIYTQLFLSMTALKRSSDEYIQLNKKITNKDIRDIISILSKEWKVTDQEVCYEFIRARAVNEIEKRKKR